MTVCKLSSSGRALLVVDDGGNVFIAPLASVKALLEHRTPLVRFNRLPLALPVERFGVSDLWDSDGVKKRYEDLPEGATPIDTIVQRKKEEYKIFDDVII